LDFASVHLSYRYNTEATLSVFRDSVQVINGLGQ